jgi:hypothetical protein
MTQSRCFACIDLPIEWIPPHQFTLSSSLVVFFLTQKLSFLSRLHPLGALLKGFLLGKRLINGWIQYNDDDNIMTTTTTTTMMMIMKMNASAAAADDYDDGDDVVHSNDENHQNDYDYDDNDDEHD